MHIRAGMGIGLEKVLCNCLVIIRKLYEFFGFRSYQKRGIYIEMSCVFLHLGHCCGPILVIDLALIPFLLL